MKNFLFFLEEYIFEESATSSVENDDKGKLHELLLAKHLHPEKKLPSHHRSYSENEEHAGTPQQVHDRLRAKVGEDAYNEIDNHAKQTAAAVLDHLTKRGHLGGREGHKITDVHWTSNRDTENKSGDHEKTTGQKDVNSNADIILTTTNKHGKKVFHGISAKYGSQKQPNFKNAGLDNLEKQAKQPKNTYTNIMKQHENRMESIGSTGTKAERHAKYKLDKVSSSAAAKKRATEAEKSSLQSRTQIARLHDKALSAMSDPELRAHITSQVSPKTKINHLIAHSLVNKKTGTATSVIHDADHIANEHLDNYENLHVKSGNGISSDIYGTHKTTGKIRKVASQVFKATSGPHKGTAGALRLGALRLN